MISIREILDLTRTSRHRPWFIIISDIIGGIYYVGPLVVGASITLIMTVCWWYLGVFYVRDGSLFVSTELYYLGHAVFFSVLSGYAVGSCALLTNRAAFYLTSITPNLPCDANIGANCDTLVNAMKGIRPSSRIASLFAGLIFGLSVAFSHDVPSEPRFIEILTRPQDFSAIQIALPIHAIVFWILIFQVFIYLFKISCFFNQLGNFVNINLLNSDALKPFGHVASSNTATIVVGIALTPLLFLGKLPDVWTDISAVFIFVLPITVAIFFLPIYKIRKRFKASKTEELTRIQAAIDGDRSALSISSIAPEAVHFRLPELLFWRHEVKELPELPIDIKVLSEIGTHACAAALVSSGAWIATALR